MIKTLRLLLFDVVNITIKTQKDKNKFTITVKMIC